MRDFNLNSNLCGLKSLDIQKSKWIYDDKELLNAGSIINGIFALVL